MQPTIAQLFDPRGGVSCLSDRCEVCNDQIEEGARLCDGCDLSDLGEDNGYDE